MDNQPDWHDPRFRTHLYDLDAPGLAQELLRQNPSYITGYRSLVHKLGNLRSLRLRYEMAEQFARYWGLSCTG
ncbi:transcriptional regulator domain-containing protein [Acetobacter sp. DmW_136]|uniref:transcriptional regulator domain-containing protein n=1 Tax=Acetobacter sp. DmW_136 TaxID=2591091 RepID=UPI001239FA38